MRDARLVLSGPPDRDRTRSFGILSTFPPTSCGIATFAAALAAGLIGEGATVDVVRCGSPPAIEDPLVLASLDGTDDGFAAAVDVLDRTDVVIVQHEYGLYDGADGDALLGLLAALSAPIVVVAHTVLAAPTPHQRSVLVEACRRADGVVVMTETARTRLIAGFDVDDAKITVIAHGAVTPPAETPASEADRRHDGLRLLTWGLLGPGKGIEWAIDAMAMLTDIVPRPQYLVAGATHPKVREREGEAYRDHLVDRAARSTAHGLVRFDDGYRDLPSLHRMICSADVVVLPYDSSDQVTSGVLVDAVAAGRPVISTAFPHAVELLSSGAGLVVPQRDPDALGAAMRAVVTDPSLLASMATEARRLAPDLSWSAVARRYDDLRELLVGARRAHS